MEYDFGANGKVKGCENVIKNVYENLIKTSYKSIRQITVDTLIDIDADTAYSLWTSILAVTDSNGNSKWEHIYKEIEWLKSEDGHWKISSEAPKKIDLK
jgi:ketosteroid isomerase-like protein